MKINENQLKIKKSMKINRMEVGMDVGRLLDRFLIDFGTVLGGKLAPSWHQNLQKHGTKTMSKKKVVNKSCKHREWNEGKGGLGP